MNLNEALVAFGGPTVRQNGCKFCYFVIPGGVITTVVLPMGYNAIGFLVTVAVGLRTLRNTSTAGFANCCMDAILAVL